MKIEIETVEEACDVAFKIVSFLNQERIKRQHCYDNCSCNICFSSQTILEGAKTLSVEIRRKHQ